MRDRNRSRGNWGRRVENDAFGVFSCSLYSSLPLVLGLIMVVDDNSVLRRPPPGNELTVMFHHRPSFVLEPRVGAPFDLRWGGPYLRIF